ncbi:tetratricopeptide repeat protein [Lacibacter sp. MH-610]|uniref:tetratricopeptide repeat protein n=1 Tax=Lacibacter sp. MH-610 TaxID=3020883 RepID=UPI0038928F6E
MKRKQLRYLTGKTCMIALLMLCCRQIDAQNTELIKGNRFYKDSSYGKAEEQYRKSISKKPTIAAQYNLGNTFYQQQKSDEAITQYDAAATAAEDANLKAKALYNKGVVYHRNNKLEEAIAAYKEALRLTPDDAEVRKNLQLALQNKRQKNPEQKPKKEEKKQEEKPKEEKKQQPPPPKLSKKQAEQYLKSLTEKERQLQEKMQKKTGVPSQPEKDW